jgi:hypothetical protein
MGAGGAKLADIQADVWFDFLQCGTARMLTV